MNITSGINQARFMTSVSIDDGPEERLRDAIKNATKCVSAAETKEDISLVSTKLAAAATWGDKDQIGYILRSCYCSAEAALPALAEASSRGFEECVHILLAAGVSASSVESTSNKNALHVACEAGQESVASILISSMKSLDEVYAPLEVGPDKRLTAFDLLRQNDLNSMAKRLEAQASSLFPRI
jgi:hypothetical protein